MIIITTAETITRSVSRTMGTREAATAATITTTTEADNMAIQDTRGGQKTKQ